MRANVALLRNKAEEQRAKEKAEAPTVKTKEDIEKEAKKELEKHREKGRESKDGPSGMFSRRPGHFRVFSAQNVWRRKFRSLPEAKAVDLFADVVGDAFILSVAAGLVIYEYWKASQKPDANLEKIKDLDARFEELKRREDELERREEELEMVEQESRGRLTVMEEVLRTMNHPKTKKPLLPPVQEPAETATATGSA